MSYKKASRTILYLLIDLILTCSALYIAALIRFEDGMAAHQKAATLAGLPVILGVYALCFLIGGMYRVLWRYAGVHELARLTLVCAAAGVVTVAADALLDMNMSRTLLVLTAGLTIALTTIFRFLRYLLPSRVTKDRENKNRTLILGAGAAGAYAVNMCKANRDRFGSPVGFLDDDKDKIGMRIQDLPVFASLDRLEQTVEEKAIDIIVIAIPTLSGSAMVRLIDKAQSTKKRVYVFSAPKSNDKAQTGGTIRELNPADMLPRDEVKLNDEGILSYIEGRTVLVTGGGGSIGSEICRQLVRYNPANLVIFDIYENTAYELLYDLRQRYKEGLCPVHIRIGSIRDAARLAEVFDEFQPAAVFHAAAHKHVPLMETSPAEAVKNNVFGTYNVLSCAADHHVERFVTLSTDKAVKPSNVMGATKRVTEMLVQYFAMTTDMLCMAVRFGNVLGSHGSVIPLWEGQIKSGGPVTLGDPQLTRYFMTIPEAAQLVLQAGHMAMNSAIYVLEMGKPYRMLDLAENLIRFYGYEPGVNMQIAITGLRPGEKMHEELLTELERSAMTKTAHDKITVAPPIPMDEAKFLRDLNELKIASARNDEQVIKALMRIVPTFDPHTDG